MNRHGLFFIGLLIAAPPLSARARYPEPTDRAKTFSLTEGEEIDLPARRAQLPAYVFGDPTGHKDLFVPSGYMGDTAALKLISQKKDPTAPMSADGRARTSLRVTYEPKGSQGWAGVYWLNPANNWGQRKGAGYDLSRADRLTVWLRGKDGGEIISAVKAGGVSGPYPDSDVANLGPLKLSDQWEEYSIPLDGKDFSHIVGGIAFLLQRRDNPRGATFYMSEVAYRNGEAAISTETASSPSPKKLSRPFEQTVYFTNAERDFGTTMKDVLAGILDKAKTFPGSSIQLTGYTDNIGTDMTNLKLSRERAKAVADYLMAHGVDENRINVVGRGEENPVADNATPEGRKKNRRVEVRLEEK